jgi:hypothetical protein
MSETQDTIKEVIYTGSTTDIKDLIDTCGFLDESWVLLERNPRDVIAEPERRQNLLYFAEFSAPLPNDLLEHTNGRIFNMHFELRWEQAATDIQVIYTGITRSISMPIETAEELADYRQRTRSYYLFGKRLNNDLIEKIGPPAQVGDFAEVQIPRLLRYPANLSKDFVKLETCEYIDKPSGELILFRFTRPLEVSV